ncbi:MFS transporter [Sulfobacillus thermosulfidooxidans]|uniref:MFS transporter n=1 Tax=Sulfobacillus thermosulfidooxidans TaxID=28034 RepID=UPI0006B64639|nr:MFS transporter [Sulfobacillus thermosulfidooxidans]
MTNDENAVYRTDIPARLDRLPWSRWHWLIIISLGITWILDGLEVTIVGSIGSVLQERVGLDLTAGQVGLEAGLYLAGGVSGALVLGYLTDKWGRKRLFLWTLIWYALFTVLSGFSWNFLSFGIFRFLTGVGIGGEYAAINSAIDELIPAYRRGWTDLAINSSWWIGTMIGSVESIILLNPHVVNPYWGWRLTFLLGAILAVAVLLVRKMVPESPRWLLTHGRGQEAERVMNQIERVVVSSTGKTLEKPQWTIDIDPKETTSLRMVARTLFRQYPRRTVLSLSLMITQAFLYNAIFFTESLVLTTFFGVHAADVGYYIFPFAIGNLLGPWLLGPLFDRIGRKPMIAGTYLLSGFLLFISAELFLHHVLTATTITIAWSVIFFFASAGASSAYLTASEVFPIESRAMAIAFVYAIGTLVGGVVAPPIFGALIQTKSVGNVFTGYLVGTSLMALGGVVALWLGVQAERQPLEKVARPLTERVAKSLHSVKNA